MSRRWRVAGAAVALVLAAFGSGAGAAAQAPVNRAAVVIDTGTEVRRVCIRFDAESISAEDALKLAGADPEYSEFGGELGSFVCQLCGYPSPIGDCPSGGDNWWYHRADAGQTGFAPSGVGVSSTTVEDGDVEGWAWGRGGPPDFVDVDTVCGEVEVEVPTTPPPATTQPSPPDTTPTTRSIPSLPAPIEPLPGAGPTTTGLTTTTAATTSTSGGPTTSATSATQEDRADGDLASASNPPDDGASGGSPLGLAAVGTLLVAGLGGAVALRRRRSGPGTVPT